MCCRRANIADSNSAASTPIRGDNMLPNEIEDEIRSLAHKSQMKFRMACIILSDGDIVGTGYNKPLAPVLLRGKGFRSLHAEMEAMKNMMGVYMEGKRKLAGAEKEMYVVRVRPDGSFGNAKPCSRCLAHIKNLGWGIRKVIYTNERGEFETIIVP